MLKKTAELGKYIFFNSGYGLIMQEHSIEDKEPDESWETLKAFSWQKDQPGWC